MMNDDFFQTDPMHRRSLEKDSFPNVSTCWGRGAKAEESGAPLNHKRS